MKQSDRREFERLSAYCDGELRGFARWRFERRLARDPLLCRELELLRRVSDAVREAGAAAPHVDLWDRIAMRLPAADAARARSGGGPHFARLRLAARPLRGLARAPAGLGAGWLVGAPVAAGLAALALVWWPGAGPGPADGVVRWMYAGKRDVFVLEAPGDPGTTIIWVLDDGPRQTARRESGVRA